MPRLTKLQIEALNMINILAEENCYEYRIEPGEIQILNNHLTYHARTAYTDDKFTRQERFLLRIWLSNPASRLLPKIQASLWSSGELTNSRLSKFSLPS